MIINVDTVRGIIMGMNDRSFDDIVEDYSATWFRARIVGIENPYPLFTKWCKTGDSIDALNSLIDDINRSNTKFCARLQSMEVHVTKGVEYGIIEEERKDR